MSGLPDMSFGPFALRNGVLWRDGEQVALGQRALALLGALAGADGSVTKQALMEAGWPGTIVEEGNLTVQIAALRKTLGSRLDGGEWIVTVPRVGYRLARGEMAPPTKATGLPVLALLTFENIGGSAEAAAFAEGLGEELVAALGRFKGFTLLSRTATSRYTSSDDVRGIAKELNADYLVEGSVRRSGEQLRVAARLSVGSSGVNAWSHTFEGNLAEGFALQDSIASVTAAQISRTIRQAEVSRSAQERPVSGQAYDIVQRGIALLEMFGDTHNRKAILLLEEAVALDPRRALTLAMATWGYEQRIHAGWATTGADGPRCLELARMAIALGGDDATVLSHCGIALQLCGDEWEHGLQTTLHAVDINPSSATALMFAGVAHLKGGSLDGARAVFDRALTYSIDDELGNAQAGLAHVLICEGRFEEAASIAARAVAMRPRFFWAHWALIASNAQLGRVEAAGKALEIYRAVDSGAVLDRVRYSQRTREPGRNDGLFDGLRLAGMPET